MARWLVLIRNSLPRGVIELAVSEARVLEAAWASISRRPIRPVATRAGWRRFSAMRTSSYGNTVAMLLLLIVVEAPAIHVLLGAVMEEGAWRGLVRGVFLCSNLYLAVWLLGDLRLLRETPGVSVGSDMFTVDLGLRVRGEVPLELVTAARRIAQDEESTGSSRGIRITPQPPPNCRIFLSSTIVLRGLFGIPLKGETLDLYVDDPEGLVSSLDAH